MPTDDDLLFADEAESEANAAGGAHLPRKAGGSWRVLLVDDERDVHAVTRMALSGLQVDGCPVEVVSALSGAEGRRLLAEYDDIALAILDVVMEAEDSGLQLARHIRSTYSDRSVRIVLRTGQPGVAPEEQVLRDYDINDYWAKTELTAMRMRTLVTGNLRSCRDLRTIDMHRVGLTRVIGSTASLFKPLGVEALVQAILDHLTALLPARSAVLFFVAAPAGSDTATAAAARVLGATGRFEGTIRRGLEDVLDRSTLELVSRCVRQSAFVFEDNVACFGFGMTGQPYAAIFMESVAPLSNVDRHMVELFCRNAAIAFHNQSLTEERLRLLAAVSRFVPDRLLALLGRGDVGDISLGDHAEREMTVLFGDLRSFSRMAEQMSSAQTFELLKSFHACIGPAIARHAGIVDKYLGDGIMVLFPDGPRNCVDAAMDVLSSVAAMNRERTARGEVPLALSLGAHDGKVTVGTLGFADRLETTVVADTVNVASRLEKLTREYRCSLVISEQVHDALDQRQREDCRCLGTIPIKGREGRIRIFEVFGADDNRAVKRMTRMQFEAAVSDIENGRWADATATLDQLMTVSPDDGAVQALRDRARRAQAAA